MRSNVICASVSLILTILPGCDQLRRHPDEVDAYGGNPHDGQQLIARYGCSSCHTVPGIAGAQATVGPSSGHPWIDSHKERTSRGSYQTRDAI
jgi:hypothetical protein